MKRSAFFPVPASLLAAFLLSACMGDEAAPGDLPTPRVNVSEAQCAAFAKELETSIANNDKSVLEEAVDLTAMFDRITTGLNTSQSDRDDFLLTVPRGFGLADEILGSVGSAGHFHLLRLTWNEGHPRALFRVKNSEGGLNYLDFYLADRNGKVTIVDVFIHISGELFSSSVRRLVKSDSRHPLAQLVRTEEEGSMVNAVDSMAKLVKAGEGEKALDFYETQPERVKQEKIMAIHRVTAASALDENRYRTVLADVVRRFGGDPAVDLLLLDHYSMTKQYDSALASIARLDQRVGGDPYLDVVRARMALECDRFEQARGFASNYITHDSSTVDAHWVILTVALMEKKHEEVVQVIDAIEEKSELVLDPTMMRLEPLYKDFVASAEFRAWEQRHEGR